LTCPVGLACHGSSELVGTRKSTCSQDFHRRILVRGHDLQVCPIECNGVGRFRKNLVIFWESKLPDSGFLISSEDVFQRMRFKYAISMERWGSTWYLIFCTAGKFQGFYYTLGGPYPKRVWWTNCGEGTRTPYLRLRGKPQQSWPKVAQAERDRFDSQDNLWAFVFGFMTGAKWRLESTVPMHPLPTAHSPAISRFLCNSKCPSFFWSSRSPGNLILGGPAFTWLLSESFIKFEFQNPGSWTRCSFEIRIYKLTLFIQLLQACSWAEQGGRAYSWEGYLVTNVQTWELNFPGQRFCQHAVREQ